VTDPDDEPTLANVQRQLPAWECSIAFGWCWAHLCTGPDVSVRGEDPLDLRDMINRWIGLQDPN
jgi:hypothetical protein